MIYLSVFPLEPSAAFCRADAFPTMPREWVGVQQWCKGRAGGSTPRIACMEVSHRKERNVVFVVCVVVQALQSSIMIIQLYDGIRSPPSMYGNLDSYERKKKAQGSDIPLFLANDQGRSANSKMLRTQQYDRVLILSYLSYCCTVVYNCRTTQQCPAGTAK